jgi:hypothetical protein
MIDKHSRQSANDLLKRLVSAEITTDDFEEEFPLNSPDKALRAIYQRLWFLWDDRCEQRLTGNQALNDDQRALVARIIAFLDSDIEYQWPGTAVMASFRLLLFRLFGRRNSARRFEQSQLEQLRHVGDINAWPFASVRQYVAVTGGTSQPNSTKSGA